MAKKISRVNTENAIKRRKEFLDNTLNNLENANIHFSMGNSKMGPIPSFSVLPFLTCKNCNGCGGYCYAAKGAFNFPKNVQSLADNTALLMRDPERVEKEINSFLNNSTILYRYFRFNVAGDIAGPVEKEYLPMVIRIAEKNPWTKFLLFTKNYSFVNSMIEKGEQIPENLTIVFSKWDNIPIDNRYNLPVAIVKVNEETEIPESAFHCSGDCANCLNCWHAKSGDVRYFDLH